VDLFDEMTWLVKAKLAARLLWAWECRADGQMTVLEIGTEIGNLCAYAAVVARNACVDHLRAKYPGRHALDVALRSALAALPNVGLWSVSGGPGKSPVLICGFSKWRNAGRIPVSIINSRAVEDRLRSELAGVGRSDVLARAFNLFDSPYYYSELLTFLADYWDVERIYRITESETVLFRVPMPYLSDLHPERIVETIGLYQRLWPKLKLLSEKQAKVIMFKLPDYDEDRTFLDALVEFTAATWLEIADVTGVSTAVLTEITAKLPLEDTALAELLSIGVVDVRRIRQDARRKLSRMPSEEPDLSE
jgi:hypothetical protein